MEKKNFLNYVRLECKKHGVKLRLSPYKRVKAHGYCAGYFCSSIPEIAVARKNKDFWSILVHEFCHMQQWIEQVPEWVESKTTGGYEAWELMEGYLSGTDYPQQDIDEAFAIIIKCERDCDMRTVKMVKKYNLPIDVSMLIKQSNAYHWFYHIVKEKRKWYGKTPIYSKKKVLELCPDNFRTNPSKGIPDDVRKMMLRYI